MFTRLLAILSVLLGAAPAWAAPQVTSGKSPASTLSTTVTFKISDTADSEAIPVSGFCSVRYQQAGGDDAALYAVPTAATAATSGTLIGAFTSSTTTATTFTAGTRWVKAVATDATVGGSVMVIDCSPLTGGGGSDADADNDNLYEYAYIWDADGDGSTYVTCTDKDEPDAACKAEGEVIYRDWADDINCAMHGCGFGQMEIDGSIYHREGVVYVNFPCWDARESTGFNDPEATSESLRDSTADTAWTHCPQTPDYSTSARRFMTVATLGWKGEIIGAGSDPRDPNTTGYIRDTGTYIADDRGPSWASGTQANLNSWFGVPSFIRGISFGFNSTPPSAALAGTATDSGEWSSDGDSKGGGTVSGDQTLTSIDGTICVTTTGWATTLVPGDIIEVYGTTQLTGFTSPVVVVSLRVQDTPDGTTCNGAGTTNIPIGGRVYDGTAQQFDIDPPLITQLTSGSSVVHARSDYLSNAVKFTGFTLTPQDYWNETGGDCSGAGVWQATNTGTIGVVQDGAVSDFDCDTNPLIGLYGGGTAVIEDIVVKNWHNHAIDGNSNVGSPRINRVRYFFGNGGTVLDPGTGWRANDLEIRESQFGTDVIAGYGPGFKVDDVRIYNSSFLQITTLASHNLFSTYSNIRVFNSAFVRLWTIGCGARQNSFRDIEVSGHVAYAQSQAQAAIARFACATTSTPIEMNRFTNVRYNGSGLVGGNNATSNTGALIVFDFDDTNTSSGANASARIRNTFEGFTWRSYDDTASSKICLFGVQDDEASATRDDGTPDYSQEDVFTLNKFWGNSIYASGGATDYVYCNCGLWDGVDNASANECDKAIKGSGSGGADPSGCMNFDAGGAPASQVCS